MKPLKLTFSGLRSYVSEQCIDFRGRDLVGITGDTGAGKSTILIAINFALYGTTTWEAPSPKVLIADGGDGTLRVSLEFEARGRQWRVTRELSRKPTDAEHKLEALDGSETVRGRAVTPRIGQLIGMDNKTFLRSVLLPQGKFEQLLHASTSERAGILKGILGLDILDAIADTVRRHRDALTPAFADLRARKDALGDPRAMASAAAAEAEATGALLDQLAKAQAEVAALARDEKTAADAHGALSKLRTTLAAAFRTDAAQQLRQLAGLDIDITTRDAQLVGQSGPLQIRRDELLAELGDFRPGGSQAEMLTTALGKLPQLHERLINESQHRQRNRTDAKALEVLQEEAAEAAAEQARYAPLLTDAETILDNHVRAVRSLTDNLTDLRSALTAVRDLAQHGQELGQTKEERDGAADRAAKAMEEARDAATAVEKELTDADAELQRRRRANAAAHAGEGLDPGSPCPVCQHPLPDEYTPPHAPDLQDAERALAKARTKAKKAGEAVTDAVAVHREAQGLAIDAGKTIETHATRLQAAIDDLATKIGPFSLDSDDDVILAVQLTAHQEAADKTPGLTEMVESLRTGKTAAAARVKTLGKQIEKQAAALDREERELTKLTAEIAELVAQIPEPYRPEHLSVDAVDAQHHAAVREQKDVATQWQVLDRLDLDLADIATRRRGLDAQRTEQVSKPATGATQAVLKLRTAQAAIAERLSLRETPDIDLDADIHTRAEWATQVADDSQNAMAAADQKLLLLDQTRRRCGEESAAILNAAPTGGTSLDEALSDAIGRKAVADSTYRDATAKTIEYDALAGRLRIVQPHMDGLTALVKLLSDGKFVAGVVNERQQTLLGTATGLLRGMSLGQFAFGPDFQVWDEHTCRLRDVKTLSGGETFQASLALALALVEHASSSGGQTEALFLDEGFGTLDQTSLSEALEALASQASAGRLVVVISHMLAVAQHVTSLIRVKKTPTGSSLDWATDDELALLAGAADAEGLHT